jgi:rhodanese-related sulfurtransferase
VLGSERSYDEQPLILRSKKNLRAGEAALRSEAEDTQSLREALASMLEEARRLSDVIDALLLLARADTGGVSPSLQQVDLAGLLNEVRETLLVLAEEKSQQIEIAAEPTTVRADRELLRLALLNVALIELLARDSTAVLIDARETVGASRALRNAKWIPLRDASKAKDDGRLPMSDHNTRIFVVGDNGAQARAVGEAIVHDAFHNVTFFDGSVTELDVLWATSSRPSPQDL